jgi:hypothetical protein
MFSCKLIQFVILSLTLMLGACMAPLEEDLESLPDERTEADPVAKDFYGVAMSGRTWSSPAGTNGVGGLGAMVALGELELEDPSAQLATLTLGIRNLNPALAFGDGRLYARIDFGIGSANETALLDWTSTTTITIPAGKVTVTAIQVDAYGHPAATDLIGLAPNPAQTINVPIALTASLAVGPRSSTGMPTLTQTIGQLFPAAPVVMRPPQRTKRVLVGDVRGQAGSDLQVTVGGSASQNVFQLGNAADSIIRTEGVVLPGGDDIVALVSAAGVLQVPVCWLLDG